MPNWTPEQQQAISARNRTILVSAAAGSGKTAVLIERIVQLIREGWKIDRMLIVTFTKAAAAEMRQRLNKRLTKEAASDPEVMGRALDDLESTEISTIHAFCQKVLKNNFQAVGIDPMVRACDDQLKKTLFDEAWLEAFNQLLEAGDDEDFMELAYAWDEARLHEMTAMLHDFLMSLPAPFNWLDHAINRIVVKPFSNHPWYRVIKNHARLEIEGIGDILQGLRNMFNEPDAVQIRMETWQADNEAYENLMLLDWNDTPKVIETVVNFKLERAKAARNTTEAQKEWLERYKRLRDGITEIIKNARETLCIDENKTELEMSTIQRQMSGMAALVRETHRIFLEKKGQQHVIDFNDMEQFTMDIMNYPFFREQMQCEYDHIFVDECQDVSQVQDAILQSIHCDNNFMFMVGDVKQSIYRFRKADPTLFLHRIRTFSDDENALNRRIILQKNFRSRNNVLEATNQVFRQVMRPNVTELTYEAEDELICGRETENDPAVEMHLLDISGGEDGEQVEALAAEAKIVAERIQSLLNEQFNDGSEVRNYTYRDMVILLSAAANTAPKLVELLNSQGIPVFYDGAAAYYSLPEVQAVKALLSVIDNPLQDIPLMAALKMPPFSLNDRQLADIRRCMMGRDVPFHVAFSDCCDKPTQIGSRCREIADHLKEWRFRAEVMRLSDFVWHVVNESGYYAACGALPKGELRQANLRMMYQRALAYEENGGATLSGFLQLMDQQAVSDDKTSAKMLGENENLVRIMTMHKSKGLEFPIVFCMQMSGKLHKRSMGEIMMHTNLGVALPYVNRKMSTKRSTMANHAFDIQRKLDDKAERARLLYVAMTRARERLIMIGCCKGSERDVWTMPESDFRVWKASSMTDWIMQGVASTDINNLSTGYPQSGNPWNICAWSDCEGLSVDKAVNKFELNEQLSRTVSIPASKMFDSWNQEISMDDTPLKTSVSALAKKNATEDPMPLDDGDEDIDSKRVAEEIVTPLRMSEIPARPAFLEDQQWTGAERGTLTHRVLSLISLDKIRSAQNIDAAVHQAVHDMIEREVLTNQELFALPVHGVAGFFRNEIGQRLLKSEKVRREWSFNLLMDDQRRTLLQGVIDCAFMENDEWILVDYKTDRINDEDAFIQRYAMQLEWYARALERITGSPVREMWLYSISKAKAYQVARQE